jgi:hypothetical protein
LKHFPDCRHFKFDTIIRRKQQSCIGAALGYLHEEDLLVQANVEILVNHFKPLEVAFALVTLNNQGLLTGPNAESNRRAIAQYRDPAGVNSACSWLPVSNCQHYFNRLMASDNQWLTSDDAKDKVWDSLSQLEPQARANIKTARLFDNLFKCSTQSNQLHCAQTFVEALKNKGLERAQTELDDRINSSNPSTSNGNPLSKRSFFAGRSSNQHDQKQRGNYQP